MKARLPWPALALLAFAPAFAAAQTPAASAAPQVEEWINQTAPVRELATVYLAPDDSSETHGKLLAGREVRVIATLAGGGWLQVRLPDDTIGYVKAGSVELAQGSAPAEAPPQADTTGTANPDNGQPPAPAPASPAPEQPGNAAPPAPASGGEQAVVRPDMPVPAGAAPPAEIDGRPLVRDTATLVIDGHAVLLAGVEGVSGEASSMVQDHIAEHGDRVSCAPAPDMPGYYTCRLADGTDLAKLLLVNGIARIAAGAPEDYTPQQDAAVTAQKGIWALPDTCARWAITDAVATVAFTDDADEGLYFYHFEPYVLLFGEPVPMVFAAGLGWGFYGADGQWNAAPARWSQHLNNVYPGGKGLRDAGARAQDLKGGAVRGAALHEAEAHEHTIVQQHAMAERLGRPPVAPEAARPRALAAEHGVAGAGVHGMEGQRPSVEGQHPEVHAQGPVAPGQHHEVPHGPEPGMHSPAPGIEHTPTPAAQHSPVPLTRPGGPTPLLAPHTNMAPAHPAPMMSKPAPVKVCKKPPC